jgi:hypothetical protein
MVSKILNSFSLGRGDGCTKDTDHCVLHPWCHQNNRANDRSEQQLKITERTSWTRHGSVLGWSDPTFAHGSVATLMREVTPAHAPRREESTVLFPAISMATCSL